MKCLFILSIACCAGFAMAAQPTRVITLAPGVYTVTNTWKFTRSDSGTEDAPLVVRAEKRGSVRFRGGVTLTEKAFRRVTDKSVLTRLESAVRDRVRVADVSALLHGKLAAWPEAFRGMPPEPWVYRNGKPLELARWPNQSWATFSKAIDTGLTDDKNNEYAVRPGAFPIDGAPHADRWNLDEGVWADGYWCHDWDEEILRLASYDPKTHAASPRKIHRWGMTGRHGTSGMSKRRYKIVNVLAELDADDEWWLDRTTKKLYYLPPKGVTRFELVLATETPHFIFVNDASWIHFENLVFEYAHGKTCAVVTGGGAEHITFQNCEFSNFANNPISLCGQDNALVGCLIEKVGKEGVVVGGGDRKALFNGCNVVQDCEIRDFGRFLRTACGVSLNGCGNAVRGCNIHHGAAQAIRYGGNEHLISENDMHHVLLESCDAGAVYTGHDTSGLGNLLTGNYTHELGDTPALYGCRLAFYFDDCDWGDDVIGNRFYRTGTAVGACGGNMHAVHNNVMVETLHAFHADMRGVKWEHRYAGSFLIDKQGHSWAESRLLPFNYREAPWHVAYPEAAVLVDDRPNIPHSNAVSGNTIVNPLGVPFHLVNCADLAQEMPIRDNVILTNVSSAAYLKQMPPIALKDAVPTTVRSPNGTLTATFGLDVAGRFSWQVKRQGQTWIRRAPLGVTVGYRDFGKRAVPSAGRVSGVVAGSPVEGPLRDDGNRTHTLDATNYVSAIIPLRDLVTAQEVARLEVRVFETGLAFRWHVPNADGQKVYGELTAWYGKQDPSAIFDAERGAYPRFRVVPRGSGHGLVFPDAPRGWVTKGPLVTPWRVTLIRGKDASRKGR